jgi:hypothetical protein
MVVGWDNRLWNIRMGVGDPDGRVIRTGGNYVNNIIHVIIKETLFFANYRLNPIIIRELIRK